MCVEARLQYIVSFFLLLWGNDTYSMLDVKVMEIKIRLISAFAEIQLLLQLVRNSFPIIPGSTSVCNKEIAFIPRWEKQVEIFSFEP